MNTCETRTFSCISQHLLEKQCSLHISPSTTSLHNTLQPPPLHILPSQPSFTTPFNTPSFNTSLQQPPSSYFLPCPSLSDLVGAWARATCQFHVQSLKKTPLFSNLIVYLIFLFGKGGREEGKEREQGSPGLGGARKLSRVSGKTQKTEFKLLKFLENFYAPPSTRRPVTASLLPAPKNILKTDSKTEKNHNWNFQWNWCLWSSIDLLFLSPIFVSFCVVLFFLSSRSIEK